LYRSKWDFKKINGLVVHVMHILANIDRAPKEFIWECLYDRELMKNVFDSLNIICANRFCEGLREIQLRSRGKWDEQLPYIFAIACEELLISDNYSRR